MAVEKTVIVRAQRLAAALCAASVLAATFVGGATLTLADSGEIGAIYLEDTPGFVGPNDADTVIACLPNGECVAGPDAPSGGGLLTGFRPEIWPDLRLVEGDLILESDVDVQATGFGRVLARDGFIAETLTVFSQSGDEIVGGTGSVVGPFPRSAVTITPDSRWAPNNFDGSDAVWISYADTGAGGSTVAASGTTMIVSETFTVPADTTANLTGFAFADDTARVVLTDSNGTLEELFDFNTSQQTCAQGPIGCEVRDEGELDVQNLLPGTYTLSFTALQVGAGTTTATNPFGLMYGFEVRIIEDVLTVADVCWAFDGGALGEKVCVSIAESSTGASSQCPGSGTALIELTSGVDGEAICENIAGQFAAKGLIAKGTQLQYVVGLDLPETSQPGSVRVATCTVDSTPYVPICRDPAGQVVDADVRNDIAVIAVETPRCVYYKGTTYC